MNRKIIAPILIIVVSITIAVLGSIFSSDPKFWILFGAVLLISTYITNTSKFKNKQKTTSTKITYDKKQKTKKCQYCGSQITERTCPNCGAKRK